MIGGITDFGRVHTPCDDCDNGHCTMNCSPRDAARDERTVKVTLQVAPFWPKDGAYGGGTTVETMAQAEASAAEYEEMGYGGGRSIIHIIRTTQEIIAWEISPASAAKAAAEEAARAARNGRRKRKATEEKPQP